jgi:hypothetical protein
MSVFFRIGESQGSEETCRPSLSIAAADDPVPAARPIGAAAHMVDGRALHLEVV